MLHNELRFSSESLLEIKSFIPDKIVCPRLVVFLSRIAKDLSGSFVVIISLHPYGWGPGATKELDTTTRHRPGFLDERDLQTHKKGKKSHSNEYEIFADWPKL